VQSKHPIMPVAVYYPTQFRYLLAFKSSRRRWGGFMPRAGKSSGRFSVGTDRFGMNKAREGDRERCGVSVRTVTQYSGPKSGDGLAMAKRLKS
jgi:hypothetical protein